MLSDSSKREVYDEFGRRDRRPNTSYARRRPSCPAARGSRLRANSFGTHTCGAGHIPTLLLVTRASGATVQRLHACSDGEEPDEEAWKGMSDEVR